jgi:cold shock CspA family protein
LKRGKLFHISPSFLLTIKITAMTQGIIKWYSEAKGFGFITCNEVTKEGLKEDMFFHFKQLNYSPCQMGDKVTFDTQRSDRKPGKLVATNIDILT